MRTLSLFLAIALMCGLSADAMADDDIPDLVGRWTIKAEGMAIPIPGGGPAEPVSAESEFVIDKQEGFRISGRETDQRVNGKLFSGEEHFAGVIGLHNKTVSMIDENGFRDCDILTPDRMVCIYRHVASPRAVVTRNVWTKQSD